MSTANPLSIRRSSVNLPQSRRKPNVSWARIPSTHPKPKKSKLFDTSLNEIVLHRNCSFWQNAPGSTFSVPCASWNLSCSAP